MRVGHYREMAFILTTCDGPGRLQHGVFIPVLLELTISGNAVIPFNCHHHAGRKIAVSKAVITLLKFQIFVPIPDELTYPLGCVLDKHS